MDINEHLPSPAASAEDEDKKALPVIEEAAPTPAPEPTPEAVAEMQGNAQMDTTGVPQNQAPTEQPPTEMPAQQQVSKQKTQQAPMAPMPTFDLSPPPETKDDLDAEEIHHIQDMATGAINPKTYHSMWADKKPGGKIMTLIGLALSGIGAGLSRQPNMLLEMMNKEIERDLEAQKVNKEGARNFLTTQFQHDLQKAQARRMQYENQVSQVEAQYGIPARARLTEAEAKQYDITNAWLSVENNAKNKMLADVLGRATDAVKDNPQGQQFIQSTLAPAIGMQIQKNNADTANKLKLSNDLNKKKAAQQAEEGTSGIYETRMQKLMDAGRLMPNMPGVIPPTEVGHVMDENKAVKENRAVAKIYDDSFKKLDQALAAGKLNKQFRDAEMNALGAAVARATAGKYNQAEAAAQASGMFPDWKDYGSARSEKYRKTMEFFKGQESGTPYLDKYKLKAPFPDLNYGTQKEKGGGVPVVRLVGNREALFDPITKKFIKYKDESQPVAKAK